MHITAQQIIEQLQLKPHPLEGGFYKEIYRSEEMVNNKALPDRYKDARPFSTAIYYLLTADTVSHIHRLKSDEVFHFYLGDPVTMFLLYPDASSKTVVLGNDLSSNQQSQYMVPKNVWQGAIFFHDGQFALLGVTVARGFDLQDFELGRREELIQSYPQEDTLINLLTRGPS